MVHSGLSKDRLDQACGSVPTVTDVVQQVDPNSTASMATLQAYPARRALSHHQLACLLCLWDDLSAMRRHSQTEHWRTSTAVGRQAPASRTSTRRLCRCPWQRAAAAQAAPLRALCWRPAGKQAPRKRALCPCAACRTSAMLQCWLTGMCGQPEGSSKLAGSCQPSANIW